MPIGPYEDFASCVAAKRRDGLGEESARKYCGKIQQAVEGSMRPNANSTAAWLKSPAGVKAQKERARQVKDLDDLIREAQHMGNSGEARDLKTQRSELMAKNLREFAMSQVEASSRPIKPPRVGEKITYRVHGRLGPNIDPKRKVAEGIVARVNRDGTVDLKDDEGTVALKDIVGLEMSATDPVTRASRGAQQQMSTVLTLR